MLQLMNTLNINIYHNIIIVNIYIYIYTSLYIIYGIVCTHLQSSQQSKLLVTANAVTPDKYDWINLIFKKAPTTTVTHHRGFRHSYPLARP